jgi:hypothetical protein
MPNSGVKRLILRRGNVWHYETLFSVFVITYHDSCGSQSTTDTFFVSNTGDSKKKKAFVTLCWATSLLILFLWEKIEVYGKLFSDVCSNYVLVNNMKFQITVETEAAERPSCTAPFPNWGSAETQDSAKRSWVFTKIMVWINKCINWNTWRIQNITRNIAVSVFPAISIIGIIFVHHQVPPFFLMEYLMTNVMNKFLIYLSIYSVLFF